MRGRHFDSPAGGAWLHFPCDPDRTPRRRDTAGADSPAQSPHRHVGERVPGARHAGGLAGSPPSATPSWPSSSDSGSAARSSPTVTRTTPATCSGWRGGGSRWRSAMRRWPTCAPRAALRSTGASRGQSCPPAIGRHPAHRFRPAACVFTGTRARSSCRLGCARGDALLGRPVPRREGERGPSARAPAGAGAQPARRSR